MTYRELYLVGKEKLTGAGIADAGCDARLLLEHVCGTDANELLAHPDRPVGEENRRRYLELLGRRESRIPLQYLTGVQGFMGLDFLVNETVLIPRQDTEILVEEVLRNLHDGMTILDLGTGSGCILISLMRYSNDCEGLGVDLSAEAISTAEENARRLVPECVRQGKDGKSRLRFVESDLYRRVEGRFDVVVSNPPYIPSGVIGSLMPEVRDHEPLRALDGGGDGLLFYRRILSGIGEHLKGGGMLFLEIGHDQGQAVSELVEQAGFLEVCVTKDYAGQDRVVSGVRSVCSDAGM